MKDLEKEMLQAKERFEKEKANRENRARRIRTRTASGIFTDEDSERQFVNLEREAVRKPGRKLRRVKKGKLVKSSPSSQGAVSENYEQPPVMGGCNNDSPKKAEDEEMDLGDMEGKGDFQGIFPRDKDSKFRKIVNRFKSKTQSDPIMKGRIMAVTGGRRVKFCADTGCSVNIMPAKIAALGGNLTGMNLLIKVSPMRISPSLARQRLLLS